MIWALETGGNKVEYIMEVNKAVETKELKFAGSQVNLSEFTFFFKFTSTG